jgi:peptidoglycan glycosyltransferase
MLDSMSAESLSFLKNLSFLRPEFNFENFRTKFNQTVKEVGDLPSTVTVDNQKYVIEYTLKTELEDYAYGILKHYRSDYASIVIIDNETGNIITALEHDKTQNKLTRIGTFTPSHPAASVFKIITAADLLENTHISQSTEFTYSGRSTTLFKYQLKSPPKRWSRKVDFEQAFAKSNNVIFGKAAIDNLSPTGLKKMAEKFGFNRNILPLGVQDPSIFPLALDQYNLAELASGFNVKTLMTPVHGALIASIIANGGNLKSPALIDKIKNEKGEVVWQNTAFSERVINPETAEYLRKLMIATVEDGTARRAFRKKGKSLSEIEIGGKTGSITGGIPRGKRDWFVAYARETNNPQDKGISICVMIVNKKRWYVKSTMLTKDLIEYYYNNFKG